MMHSSTLFNIDAESVLPINVQLKEQIKWLIGNNYLKPGDSLPSTNQLAAQLSINRNTIQSIYSQLKDEGLLTIRKGSGTQIAASDHIEAFKQAHPYFSFVEQSIKDMYDLGYDPENALLAGLAYVQLFNQPIVKKTKYLFIECKSESCVFYLDEVKRMAAPNVQTIDLSLPLDVIKEAVDYADIIITRSDLAERLKQLDGIEHKTVINVGTTQDVSLLLNILRP